MLCQLQIKMLGNLDLSKAFDQILDLIEKFLHNKTFFYIFVNRMSNNYCPISCYESGSDKEYGSTCVVVCLPFLAELSLSQLFRSLKKDIINKKKERL